MGPKRNAGGMRKAGSGSNSRASKRLKGLDPGGSAEFTEGQKYENFADEAGRRGEYGEENASTHWISDDTLMVVMSFFSTRYLLSRLAFVCRRWRRLSTGMISELLPPRLESAKPWGQWAARPRFLELVDCYKPTVEKIALCGLPWLTVADAARIISSLPKLKHLTMDSGFSHDSTSFLSFARELPEQLLSLDLHVDPSLRALHPESQTVNEDFWVELQNRCPQLQKLDLGGHNATWQGLEGFLRSCRTLTFLDVQSEMLGWPEVHTVLKQCSSLVHLSVVSPLLGDDVGTVAQAGRRLGFRSREGVRSTGADAEAQLPDSVSVPASLSSLRLYTSPHRSVKLESAPALRLLRKLGHQLHHLHAQGLFNASWQTISVWCLNLVSLDLSHPKERTLDLTEIEEIVLRGLVKLLRKLEKLALPSATDSILSHLARYCPKLEELHFQGHYLSWREIHPRPDVTNQGVIQLSEGCPNLRVLNLAGCQNITVASARSLAFHCKGLQALYLSGCRNFSDDGVKALLPLMSKSLAAVDLVGCWMLTSAIFTAIMEAAEKHGSCLRVLVVSQSLYKVYLRDCKQISERLPVVRVVFGSSWEGFYHGRHS